MFFRLVACSAFCQPGPTDLFPARTTISDCCNFSLAQSRHRMKSMGMRSAEIDRFAKRLCLDSTIAFKFRNSRFLSVELIIQGLDLLTRTAERYGTRGRKVFCINQDPIIDAIRLLDYLSLENAEEVIAQRLANSLKSPPEFDPEGWASTVYREC